MKMKTLSKTMVFFTLIFLLSSAPADAGPIKKAWKWITHFFQEEYGTYHDGASNKTAPVTTFDRAVFYAKENII